MADDTPLTDAEYAEMLANRSKLQAAYREDPVATTKAMRDTLDDMRDFPGKRGKLK